MAPGRSGSRGAVAQPENMAELRVRLKFDYPPPAEPHNHHMWMLLNPEHLRTVTDLSDLIRARYYPRQRGALSLYVHDCLLPPAESARLIRDNDVIRVQWIGHDLEDDSDGDNHGCQSKKRSRRRYEEEEDAATLTPKKQKCEELSDGSRRKAKKKKSEERAQEENTASKILSLLRPNIELPTKTMRVRSDSSSQQETSTIINEASGISIQPITTIEVKDPSRMTLHLFAAVSGKKKSSSLLSINKKPSKIPPLPVHVTNHETSERREISNSDSETSDQEPSIKTKEPPKMLRKPEATNSTKKTKSKHESSEKRAKETSSSDSEISDQEPSIKTKEPPKVLRKPEATNSTKKTKSKHESSEKRAKETSSSDSETSSDQEPSIQTKEPPKMLRKLEANNSTKKTKSNHESSEKRAKETSSSDSETSSHQEPSTRTKEPPKELRKPEATNSAKKTKSKHEFLAENATVMTPSEASTIGKKAGTSFSVNQNVPNHKSGAERTRSSHEQNPEEATSDPSEAITGFPCEMRNNKGSSSWHNGGISTSRLVDAVTVSAHNGRLSPGCDSHTRPVESQCLSSGGVYQKHDDNPAVFGRGRGQGIDRFPWRGQGGRGFRDRGRGQRFFHDYDAATLKKHQLEDVVTNTSVIIENPAQSPPKDYDTLPLLAAPPQVGRVIAFKILELNENYCPELSDYKEGVVCSYDHVTQIIEVELLSKQKKREPGKFDLVYESEDGQEIVEYAVVPECKITEPWSSLITPRLVMENRSEEGSSPQPQ